MSLWTRIFGSNHSELESASLDGFANLFKKEKVSNVIVMCGAGISTSAGITDFRSDEGLFKTLQEEYQMNNPMDVFRLSVFRQNPEPFFLSRGNFTINLIMHAQLWRIILSDNLERVSGLPDDKLIEAHGSFQTGRCINCRWLLYKYYEGFFSQGLPKCIKCDSVMKPDVVFSGERLPSRFLKSIDADFSKCDLLIIMGTSLSVQPFCHLIHKVSHNTPRLYINKDLPQPSYFSFSSFFMKFYLAKFKNNPFHFDTKDNTTDLFLPCNTDDGVQKICNKIGWDQDLTELRHKASLTKLK